MIDGLSCSISSDWLTVATVGTTGSRVYTRNGEVWTQQGSLIYGTGEVGISLQGKSVSLRADGNTL